ncbi:MAG: carbon monoxide dehydrogenase [Burkholderiales bacterium]|nr:MAG: carbon monoxide dehydrogenase [Burkholderiales bacterium]
MQMSGQRTLPVPPQQTWDALNDPEMLKACIPGCESIVATEPNRYELVMAARVGPVAARFKGRLSQSDVVEPESYRIEFDGQGGAAGFGKGAATVRLTPVESGTLLDYDVSATIGGKLAQIGSRLVDGAARKIADDFFATFETTLRERAAAAQPVAPPAGAEAARVGPTDAGSAPAQAPGGSRRIMWAIAAVGAVVVVYLLAR